MFNFIYGVKDISTLDFILVESISISPLKMRNVNQSLSLRDGTVDISYRNKLGRPIYDNRNITISTIIKTNGTIADFEKKYNTLCDFLYFVNRGQVYSDLKVSTCKNVAWIGWFSDISEAIRLGNTKYRVVIQFNVLPFSENVSERIVNYIFNSGLNNIVLNSETKVSTNKFRIAVSGEFSRFSITNGYETLNFNDDNNNEKYLSINFETYKMLLSNGISEDLVQNEKWSGDFFEIKSGTNNLLINCDGNINIIFYITERFIYSKEV